MLYSCATHNAQSLVDYDAIYGTGGVLCYRIELCVAFLAIQDTCTGACCQNGAVGEAAFAGVEHNFLSNNGPGPWLVANLTETVYLASEDRYVQYGAGECACERRCEV